MDIENWVSLDAARYDNISFPVICLDMCGHLGPEGVILLNRRNRSVNSLSISIYSGN